MTSFAAPQSGQALLTAFKGCFSADVHRQKLCREAEPSTDFSTRRPANYDDAYRAGEPTSIFDP
jgi:hypothetical protein